LMARYLEVPHEECDDPECPGTKNWANLYVHEGQVRMITDLERQLAACRAALAKVNAGAAGKFRGERDGLRKLVQRTLNYMRETDSARTAKDVIQDLIAGLEGAA